MKARPPAAWVSISYVRDPSDTSFLRQPLMFQYGRLCIADYSTRFKLHLLDMIMPYPICFFKQLFIYFT